MSKRNTSKITVGEIKLQCVKTTQQQADMLTKPISAKEIIDFLIKLHVYDSYHVRGSVKIDIYYIIILM